MVAPVRVASSLGVEVLVVTNVAGGIHPKLEPGDLVLLDEQINMMFQSPPTGPFRGRGDRFPDMRTPYDPEFQQLALEVAAELDVRLVPGTYAGVLGPSYGTVDEVRMLSTFGAHVVAMSTVPEIITARSLDLRCLGFSMVTNRATGLGSEPLRHGDVIAVGEAATSQLYRVAQTARDPCSDFTSIWILKMIQWPVSFTEWGGSSDRSDDESNCPVDCVNQVITACKSGSDGSREGAAAPMSSCGLNLGSSPDVFFRSIPENIDGLPFKMPSFDECCASSTLHQASTCSSKILERGERRIQQDGSLMQVRGDQGCEWKELIRERSFCAGIQESIPARRDHHRIHDIAVEPVFMYRLRNLTYKFLSSEHPGLESIRTEVSYHRIYLGSHCRDRYSMNGAYADGVLSSYSSNSACTIYLESAKCFEIRLNTSTPTTVTSGDSKCDRRRYGLHQLDEYPVEVQAHKRWWASWV